MPHPGSNVIQRAYFYHPKVGCTRRGNAFKYLFAYRREMEKMKDAVNAAASGEGIPTRRIAGDAGREYILQTTDDVKHKEDAEGGENLVEWLCPCSDTSVTPRLSNAAQIASLTQSP